MNYCGAGYNNVVEGVAPGTVYYVEQSHAAPCDPWTWDCININELESEQDIRETVEVYESPFDSATTTEAEAENHEAVNKTDKIFQCIESGCGLQFKSKSSLNRHWRTKHEHGGLAKYCCPYCEGVTFSYHSDLLVHQRTAHEAGPPSRRSIPCLRCTAMFRTTADLDAHMARVHEKLKLYECMQCQEKFDREFTLQIHIKRRHSMRRDYQCPYCRKMFANLYDLVHFHAPVCSTPRDFQPYKCALCPQAYRHATSLSRHKRFAHGNVTIADVRQSQLKLVVCDSEDLRPQNLSHTKTIEDRTLGSIKGLFSERTEVPEVPTLDISGDLRLMFRQNMDVAGPSQTQLNFPGYSESDFSDSAISSMDGFLSA